MKYFLTLLLFLTSSIVNAQIITEEPQEKEATVKSNPKKEKHKDQKKVKKERTPKEKTGIEIYAGIVPSYAFRTLKINEGLFSKDIGYRSNEKGSWAVSYEAGIRTPLNKFLKLSIGAAFYLNKENYTYEKPDSVFNYTNSYRQIGFPIRLVFNYGDKISFYGGVGIIPSAFLSMKRLETTLDQFDNKVEEKSIHRDNYNFFLIDAVVDLGLQMKLGRNAGLYLLLEGRRQLTNSFDNQSPYIRKSFALGLNFGIEIYL